MAANLIGSGTTVNVLAPTGGYTSGTLYAYGAECVGVAKETAAAGVLVALDLVGEWSTTQKDTGATLDWTAGEPVYLTATGGLTTVEGGTPAGIASAVAATGATTGQLILNIGNRT